MSKLTAVVDSFAIFDALIGAGVRHVVVCPGSRSAPLAYAAAAWEMAGGVRVHTMIDERAAGFYALGLVRATGLLAAVVMTSGTAPSHLYPALIESSHTGTPLLVISADRPWQMQAVGASQTTAQAGLFAAHVRYALNLPADLGVKLGSDESLKAVRNVVGRAAIAARRGPVHINVSFTDPLYPVGDLPAPGATENIAAAGAPVVGGGAQTAPLRLAELAKWAKERLVSTDFTHPVDRTHADKGAQTRVPGSAAAGGEKLVGLASQLLDLDARTVIIAADRGYHGSLTRADGSGGLQRRDPAQHDYSVQQDGPAQQGGLARGQGERCECQNDRLAHQSGPQPLPYPADLAGTLADQLGAPVLAEPSAGVVNRAQYCPHQQQVLTRWGHEIEQVIVVGTPSLSRPVGRLLARSYVTVVVVGATTDPLRPWADVTGNATAVVDHLEIDGTLNAGAQQWGEDLICRARQLTAQLSEHTLVPGLAVARAVWNRLAAGEILLAGASNAVRYLDLVAAQPPAGTVLANRGQAGIDGTVATARGLHAGSEQPVRVLLGDMTLLHDVGSLALAENECPDVDLVVIDDGGAQIFRSLEHGRAASEDIYRELFQMKRPIDYAHLAAAFGWQYCDLDWAVVGEAGVAQALAQYRGGARLLRVRCDHSRVGEQLLDVLGRAET